MTLFVEIAQSLRRKCRGQIAAFEGSCEMKVKVVHTDPLIVACLAAILNEFRCEIVYTLPLMEDGKPEANATHPEIAIIDTKLIDVNGYRLAMHLAAKHDTYVIMMAHDPNDGNITRFDSTFHWIRIPYTEQEITEEIAKVLREKVCSF